jgi:hypothetical protein
MRFWRVLVVLVVATSVGASRAAAQTSAPDEQMRRDIEALKDGQKAIQKDLEEIKRLLQGRAVADALPREPISNAPSAAAT